MRLLGITLVTVALATAMHLDWHAARSAFTSVGVVAHAGVLAFARGRLARGSRGLP